MTFEEARAIGLRKLAKMENARAQKAWGRQYNTETLSAIAQRASVMRISVGEATRARVLECVFDGATSAQIAEKTGLSKSATRRHLCGLRDDGLIFGGYSDREQHWSRV